MKLSADLVATVVIYGVAAISLAYGCALIWVQGQAQWLVRNRPYAADLMPPAFSLMRSAVLLLAWWTWTRGHLEVGDRTLSRGVRVTRILCVACVVAWAALWIAPRDFAERIEAWSLGKVYTPSL